MTDSQPPTLTSGAPSFPGHSDLRGGTRPPCILNAPSGAAEGPGPWTPPQPIGPQGLDTVRPPGSMELIRLPAATDNHRDFLGVVRERVVVFDGGMGATLEQFDLSSADYGGLKGKCHEALVLHRPDVIEGVHTSMLDAGAQVLETDTFQASRIKLGEWGLEEHTLEINTKAAEIARKAAGESRFVAGSIGPTGHLPASDDPTLGRITFRELA